MLEEEWTSIKAAKEFTRRYQLGSFAIGNKILLLGGVGNNGKGKKDIFMFDSDTYEIDIIGNDAPAEMSFNSLPSPVQMKGSLYVTSYEQKLRQINSFKLNIHSKNWTTTDTF